MRCYKCGSKTNGALFKTNPICLKCWRHRFPSEQARKQTWLDKVVEKYSFNN